MILTVAQLLYTSVGRALSPVGRDGYQTVCHSKDYLADQDVADIELRLVYHRSEISPIKRQFFCTRSGLAVVSQITFLENARDSFNRPGIYLAHCYALTKDDFLRLENNPFSLLQRIPFRADLESALPAGDAGGGDIAPTSISVHLRPLVAATVGNRSKAALRTLATLGSNAEALRRQGRQVQFCGSPNDIEEVLELAVALTPIEERINCWFDTHYYQCNLPLSTYWAVGLQSPTPVSTTITVDAATGEASPEPPDFPNHYFAGWFDRAIAARDVPGLAQQVTTASFLTRRMVHAETDTHSVPGELNDVAVQDLYLLYQREIAKLLRRRIEHRLDSALANRVMSRLLQSVQAPLSLFQLLQHGRLPDALIARALRESFEQDLRALPSKREITHIREVAKRSGDLTLLALVAIWSDSRKGLVQALEMMSPAEYGPFCNMMLGQKILFPSDLVAKSKLSILLALPLEFEGDQDFLDFVRALIAMGGSRYLGSLSHRLEILSAKSLKTVAGLIKGRPIDPDFQVQVNALLAAPPSKE